MKYKGPLLVVKNMDKSIRFYKEVLGLDVIIDYGANKTLTGGVSLQTLESWTRFINKDEKDVVFKGNNAEIYFEEDEFDTFIEKLNNVKDIEYLNPAYECSWGQRVVRFYDPDKHVIEVGENIKSTVKRFEEEGLNIEEIAKRMDVSVKDVEDMLEIN